MGFELDRATYSAIDKDRNIIVTPKGSTGMTTERFIIHWHNQEIAFMANMDKNLRITERTKDQPGRSELYWSILAIEIPEGFPESRDSVLDVIKDAMVTIYDHRPDYRKKLIFSHHDSAFNKKVIWKVF